MTSGDSKPTDSDQSDPLTEVQFALVIARMIDLVRTNPADMRQAIYDLARYKLQEQFTVCRRKKHKTNPGARKRHSGRGRVLKAPRWHSCCAAATRNHSAGTV